MISIYYYIAMEIANDNGKESANLQRRYGKQEKKARIKDYYFQENFKSIKNDHFPVPNNLKGFTLHDLKAATRNFKPDGMIGEGGFGQVYKGWIDETTLAPARP
ncbi:probable serine/threonine-protein kinase PBL3 isoform X1, partial [Tanacetum coccineum]